MNARQRDGELPNCNNPVYPRFSLARRVALFCALLATAAMPAVAARPIAVRDGWGAFVDEPPVRCWAVARPIADGRRRGDASLTVLYRPGAPGEAILLRLPDPVEAATIRLEAMSLRIDAADGRLLLTGAEARTLAAAMRGAGTLRVEARNGGRWITQRYALSGAATAMDAARIACA